MRKGWFLGLSVLLLFGCNNNQKRANSVETGVKSMGMGQFIPSIDGQIPQLADETVSAQQAFWGNTHTRITAGTNWYQDYRMNIAAAYAAKPNLNWSIFDPMDPLSGLSKAHILLLRSTVPDQPTSLGDPKQVIAAIGGGVLWTPELNKAPGGILVPGMALMSGKDFVSADLSLDGDGIDDDPSPAIDPVKINSDCPLPLNPGIALDIRVGRHDTQMMTIAAGGANTWFFATPKTTTSKSPSYSPPFPGYTWGSVGVNPRASVLSVRTLSDCSIVAYALIQDSSIKALRDKGGALYPTYADEFEAYRAASQSSLASTINGINYAASYEKGGYKTKVIYIGLSARLFNPDIDLTKGASFYRFDANNPTHYVDNPCNRPEMGALKMAIKNALDKGIAVVVAAGNHGREGFNVSHNSFATCDPRTTIVSTVGNDGTVQPYVSLGSGVTIAADGDDIPDMDIQLNLSTELGYTLRPAITRASATGTSGGSAIVAGAISLLKSAVPSLTPDQINSILQRTATKMHKKGTTLQCVLDVFDPKKPNCGAGILNLGEAMKLAISEYGGGF